MQTATTNNSVVVEPLGSRFKIRFDDDIIHPSYYRFELEALEQAQVGDEVVATINSDGGSLATGIEVVNQILNSKAQVTGVLRSNAHSCGSLIFLACHTHEVGAASEMLLHSGSGGNGGTPSQAVNRANSYKRQVRTLFETVYKGFLEDTELDQMIDEDKEFIFCEEEILGRLNNMYSYRQNKFEEHHQAMDEAMWEQNDLMVEEALTNLPKITAKDKKTFSKVKAALDTFMMEEEENNEDTTLPS